MTKQEIIDKYPKLFRQVSLSEYESCMAWGICVGDGWLNIIDQLSTELNELDVEYSQIKEKFGELRVYLDILNQEHTNKAYNIVNKYEILSTTICEKCGKPGKRSTKNSWIKTICDECEMK